MDKKSLKYFEKYNPASEVKRCPNGKSPLRAAIHIHVVAMLKLNGFMKIDEFVDVFNQLNPKNKTNVDEVRLLLLPWIVKDQQYWFYKDYIVQSLVLHDFRWFESWEGAQKGKPLYVPTKDEIVEIAADRPTKSEQIYWERMREFLQEAFHPYSRSLLSKFKEVVIYGDGQPELAFKRIEDLGLSFKDEASVQKFLDLWMDVCNNTRLKENRGHTPSELAKMHVKKKSNEPMKFRDVGKMRKLSPNDPCHCQSGKKYKKCCRLTEHLKRGKISQSEAELFYPTWMKLLAFVNEQMKVIPRSISFAWPSAEGDEILYKIREALWENPDLITELIKKDGSLVQAQIDLLVSWRDYHKKGMATIVDFIDNNAIVLVAEEGEEDIAYSVSGLSRPIQAMVRGRLPIMVDMTLLPLGDKIIYDTFFAEYSINQGPGAIKMFEEIYAKAKEIGIRTKLD